jgi:hypothetical protein
MGIPVIMLQHGLDCENYYLDEAYASHVAVWGAERELRYRANSQFQPIIAVTGNPEFDQFSFPKCIDVTGSYWLWATRPHASDRCSTPSRFPDEGLKILNVLIEALERSPDTHLIIKPHPYDYRNHYEKVIFEKGLQKRITLADSPLHDLINGANLVISEDSTAGMEVMFWGKLLVHAHFAESNPTMPFVKYGAALPGFSKEQLLASITQISSLDYAEAQKFLSGQVSFLKDFAGLCDGRSAARFVDFVSDVLRESCTVQEAH